MKTLDEVIKAFEICIGSYCSNAEHDVCPYLGASDMGCMKEPEKDALHYLIQLKLFRQTTIMQGIHKAQKDYALYPVSDWGEDEPDFNPPLTWDELKAMVGKPVWVEYGNNQQSYWVIIYGFYGRDNELQWMEVSGGNPNTLWQKDMGADEYWQAYRKERK